MTGTPRGVPPGQGSDSRLRPAGAGRGLARLGTGLALTFGIVALSLFQATTPAWAGQTVVVATYEGVINPVTAEYVADALAFAEQEHAHAFVLKLDTPGGLDTSMRLVIKSFNHSSIPVIVFVAPSGGRAASAGVFITMAAHVAAMAPGTNIGAAHPVAMGGGEMDKTMKEKVENDAVAYIKSIAEQRSRNVEWAEDAVRKSVSATESEALDLNIIDLVADSVPQLLDEIDGREVDVENRVVGLKTKDAEIREFPMGWRLELLKALSDPNIAYVLMTIGMIGLLAELYNPGAILPGIVGAISLIMAFYSLQSLPVNYAGVLLMLLGLILFILEVTVTSYGLLAIGGVISMTLGSLMLIKAEAPFLAISWKVIVPVVGTATLFSLFVVGMGVRALRSPSKTGSEGMVGLVGTAKTDLSPQGKVFVHGELWDATCDQPVPAGTEVRVTAIEGLKLQVTAVTQKGEARV